MLKSQYSKDKRQINSKRQKRCPESRTCGIEGTKLKQKFKDNSQIANLEYERISNLSGLFFISTINKIFVHSWLLKFSYVGLKIKGQPSVFVSEIFEIC